MDTLAECACTHVPIFLIFISAHLQVIIGKMRGQGIRDGKSRCGPKAHEINPATMPQLGSGQPPTSEINRSFSKACYGGHGYTWVIAPDRQKTTH